MREIRPSSLEGGVRLIPHPYPYPRECAPCSAARKGSNRRLEFELGAWFEGFCGFALVLALSQMMEHGLGPFGRADLYLRHTA
jgi:hypothetical protein